MKEGRFPFGRKSRGRCVEASDSSGVSDSFFSPVSFFGGGPAADSFLTSAAPASLSRLSFVVGSMIFASSNSSVIEISC